MAASKETDIAAKARSLVDGYRWFNGGAGLIVSPVIAKRLRELGIADGYTVQRPLPKDVGT